jgi:hypothetical protein
MGRSPVKYSCCGSTTIRARRGADMVFLLVFTGTDVACSSTFVEIPQLHNWHGCI